MGVANVAKEQTEFKNYFPEILKRYECAKHGNVDVKYEKCTIVSHEVM